MKIISKLSVLACLIWAFPLLATKGEGSPPGTKKDCWSHMAYSNGNTWEERYGRKIADHVTKSDCWGRMNCDVRCEPARKGPKDKYPSGIAGEYFEWGTARKTCITCPAFQGVDITELVPR